MILENLIKKSIPKKILRFYNNSVRWKGNSNTYIRIRAYFLMDSGELYKLVSKIPITGDDLKISNGLLVKAAKIEILPQDFSSFFNKKMIKSEVSKVSEEKYSEFEILKLKLEEQKKGYLCLL